MSCEGPQHPRGAGAGKADGSRCGRAYDTAPRIEARPAAYGDARSGTQRTGRSAQLASARHDGSPRRACAEHDAWDEQPARGARGAQGAHPSNRPTHRVDPSLGPTHRIAASCDRAPHRSPAANHGSARRGTTRHGTARRHAMRCRGTRGETTRCRTAHRGTARTPHLRATRLALFALCLLVVVAGVYASFSSWQQTVREEAERTAEQQKRDLQEQQRVHPASLGAGAAPISTPRESWTSGAIPHLYQIDAAWAELPYGGGTVRQNGCGPTALTMVYVGLTGRTDLDPGSMAAFADAGGYAPTGATEWAFMTKGAAQLGLQSHAIPVTRSSITQALEQGMPVICSVEPGDFTNIGHYIVLAGIDDRGMVEVCDPNSALNSTRRWGIQQLVGQTANCWAFWA